MQSPQYFIYYNFGAYNNILVKLNDIVIISIIMITPLVMYCDLKFFSSLLPIKIERDFEMH